MSHTADSTQILEENHEDPFKAPTEKKSSVIGKFITDYIIKSSFYDFVTYFNFFIIYLCIVAIILNYRFSVWHLFLYGGLFYIINMFRRTWKEKERQMHAHRIPFFADSIANALAVGATLEQALKQSIFYLRGDLKTSFEKLLTKKEFGKDIGVLLEEINSEFPKTGLSYITTLLEEYRDLGLGISPLLKQLASALQEKEGAEEKIRTILAGGSNYARLSIVVFGASFILFTVLMKEQVEMLMGPGLRPILLFLLSWACGGIVLVTRISSLEFSNHYALRPYVKSFMSKKQWSVNELLKYTGMRNVDRWREFFLYLPLGFGAAAAYLFNHLYQANLLSIEIAFLIGAMVSRFCIEFFLKGVVEDQLIRAVETFPDFLQVFIIGLNSGLNHYMAFQFAEHAMSNVAPELVRRELFRTKCSLEYGEVHSKAWQRLADILPFEVIVDFCETMVISPLHGESIVKSINQMMTSFQQKRLNMVEKKANSLGQLVIPVIVLAFFPLFIFAVFAPLWAQVASLFDV